MKSLYDFDVLKNDVFYRSWHILDYILAHPNMSELDKEAIKATIMDALVYYELINKEEDKLDLEKMIVGNINNGYAYELTPNILGFPCWLKEEMRKKCIYVTGGIPISIFVLRPNGTSKCVYDLNLSMSVLFDRYTLYTVNYDSPTRVGEKAIERPFIEVEINGVKYLIDTLTKRLFKSDYFKDSFGFEIITYKNSSSYTKEDLEYYQRMIEEHNQFSKYISVFSPMREFFLSVPEAQEHEYELNKSKEYYPDDWKVQDELNEKILKFRMQNENILKNIFL